jgi:hypothetical protein
MNNLNEKAIDQLNVLMKGTPIEFGITLSGNPINPETITKMQGELGTEENADLGKTRITF